MNSHSKRAKEAKEINMQFDCIVMGWIARICQQSVPRGKSIVTSAWLSEIADSEYAHYLPRILG